MQYTVNFTVVKNDNFQFSGHRPYFREDFQMLLAVYVSH